MLQGGSHGLDNKGLIGHKLINQRHGIVIQVNSRIL